MSRNKKHQQQDGSHHDQQPSRHCDITWPSVYPVRIESNADNERRHAEELAGQRAQIQVARVLNVITGIGTGVALLGLLFLWRTVGAAQTSADAAQKSANNAVIQFNVENRPIIWVPDVGQPKPNIPSGQVIWTVGYANYGKIPARITEIHKFIKLGAAGDFERSYQESDLLLDYPLPPNKIDFYTLMSKPGSVTQRTYDQILKEMPPGNITVKMVIKYTDVFGHPYETGMCLNRLNAGAVAYCREGNYIK